MNSERDLSAVVDYFENASGSLQVYPEPTRTAGSGALRSGRTARWVKWTWDTHEHSPIYYDNISIQVWEDGSWEHACHVENRSSHSDWDIWIDLYVKNYNSGSIAFVLRATAWTQDLDHGEDWNKSARGFSRDVFDLFDQLSDGTLQGGFITWKARD